MYDLEMLRWLNEQAHFRAVELANKDVSLSAPVAEKPKAVVKAPPVFPLSVLGRKLLGGPPSLAYYVELLEQGDTVIGFRNLVREYLPEYEVDILAEDLHTRAMRFMRFFSEKFFPLYEDMNEGFTTASLLSNIPTRPMGFSEESYHAFADFRPGYILALSLVESPWDHELMDEAGVEDEDTMQGGRVPILEAASELVGRALIRLIPDEGWAPDRLHYLTDDTEFEGLGDFADWVCCQTGLYHLDTQASSIEMGLMEGEPMPWTRDNVEELVGDWQQSADIWDSLHRFALLLEQDPESTFRRLLALLHDNQDIVLPMVIPKEQLTLPLG